MFESCRAHSLTKRLWRSSRTPKCRHYEAAILRSLDVGTLDEAWDRVTNAVS
jgi:hypothetical protein